MGLLWMLFNEMPMPNTEKKKAKAMICIWYMKFYLQLATKTLQFKTLTPDGIRIMFYLDVIMITSSQINIEWNCSNEWMKEERKTCTRQQQRRY